MSILIDDGTRVMIQGITGREGSYHARLMKEYDTNLVAGTSPGKGGQEVEGIPVFNSVSAAVAETGAQATILFVPARFTRDAILEAADSGLELIVAVAEGVPVQDMVYCYSYARKTGSVLIGPNTPGIISPGKCKIGFMADTIYSQGAAGIMSRSATLSYETVNNLTRIGIGQSTVVGVGGDPVPGTTFIDLLPLFESDPQTEVIILIGEIGGGEEELAAEYIKEQVTKPVIGFIAGEAAPAGKRMGHAGAIVSESGEGTAQSKKAVLEQAGVQVVEKLTEIAEAVKDVINQ